MVSWARMTDPSWGIIVAIVFEKKRNMGVSKNRGVFPKMDGENNLMENPIFLWMNTST